MIQILTASKSGLIVCWTKSDVVCMWRKKTLSLYRLSHIYNENQEVLFLLWREENNEVYCLLKCHFYSVYLKQCNHFMKVYKNVAYILSN